MLQHLTVIMLAPDLDKNNYRNTIAFIAHRTASSIA